MIRAAALSASTSVLQTLLPNMLTMPTSIHWKFEGSALVLLRTKMVVSSKDDSRIVPVRQTKELHDAAAIASSITLQTTSDAWAAMAIHTHQPRVHVAAA